jgi:hypothetical protein
MAQSNEAFCMDHLSRWCLVHGIHEIRTVFAVAESLSLKAESSEDLAQLLKNQSILLDAPEACLVKPAAAAATAEDQPEEVTKEAQPARKSRPAAKK